MRMARFRLLDDGPKAYSIDFKSANRRSGGTGSLYLAVLPSYTTVRPGRWARFLSEKQSSDEEADR
jgi:hypothetical protein